MKTYIHTDGRIIREDELKDEAALRSKETEVWKHETKIVREELEATRKEAIDLFIAYHEAKESLRVALNWIADSHDDQEGRDLIVEPFRAKHFPTKADLGLDSENAERIHGDDGAGKPRETLPPLDDASCYAS